jgi:hypothetical protein
MSLSEALSTETETHDDVDMMGADFASLPPQLRPCPANQTIDDVSYVAYISPATLRRSLEQYVEEYGEEMLERDTLRDHDPELFVNFWWYCARFSLPLPLPVSASDPNGNPSLNYCAFAAWDRSAAERGCMSAAKVLSPLLDSFREQQDPENGNASSFDWLDDQPLLSRFNLQAFHSSVWEHVDLFNVLVKLVEACDRRDFKPVGTSVRV